MFLQQKCETGDNDIQRQKGENDNMAKKLFQKGDVIMTTPAPGYYGVAIVLDDAIPTELSPERLSYPMNHIMTTRKPLPMSRLQSLILISAMAYLD